MADMILGTVQLGLDYGINNNIGKPDLKEAYQMLDYASEEGIKVLDTGPMYGNSEEIIGGYIKEKGKKFVINTKLPDQIPTDGVTYGYVENIIKKSLERLQSSNVDCFFLHQFSHCKVPGLMPALMKAKQNGLIGNIGISIYHPEELKFIYHNLSGIVDVVQIPYNIFSMGRWNNIFIQESNCNVVLFARSIFLQGLVFKEAESEFSVKIGAGKYINYIKNAAETRNSRIDQLCYDIVKSCEWIEDIIIGCETTDQLRDNVMLEKNFKYIGKKELDKISEYMSDIPSDILNPMSWNKYR